MFYLKELVLRLKFFSFSFLLVLLFSYSYKNSLLLIFSFSLLKAASADLTVLNNLIYTHPIELVKIQMLSAFLLSFFVILPYFFWMCLDFFRSSLTKVQYTRIGAFFQHFLGYCFLFNLFSFVYFLPVLWNFFQNFNIPSNSATPLNFFFELRVQEYFSFVVDFLYLVNIFSFIFIFLFGVIFYFGLATVLYWKKLFFLLNLLAATFLSPPDISSQLIGFGLLSISLEVYFFIKLYDLHLKLKIKKLIN
jgi:Sec-independent protein secretion pathway component TatC